MTDIIGRDNVDPAIFGKPDEKHNQGLSSDISAVIGPLEKHLIEFLEKELGAVDVKTVSHLQDLGASSFHMTRLASQLFDTYRIHIPVETILKAESLHEIAVRIEREIVLTMGHLSDAARYAIWDQALQKGSVPECGKDFMARYPETPNTVLETAWIVLSGALAGKPSAIPKRRDRERARLSPAQLRLWDQSKKGPLRPSQNLAFSFSIKGNLDVEGLSRSLEDLARRHDILRTVFLEEDGEPIQKVLPKAAFEAPLVSFTHLSPQQRTAEVEAWMEKEKRRPFTTGGSPLFRAHVLRLTPTIHKLSIVASRLVFDEWSINLVAAELSECYNNRLKGKTGNLPQAPVQFPDVAEWQAGRNPELAGVPFWRDLLEGELPVTRLSDQPRIKKQLRRSKKTGFVLSRPLTGLLKAMARQQGATLFQILLASFKVWLHRETGADDLIVGTVSANRKKQGLESAVGPLANTLALRTRIGEGSDFETTLRTVTRTCVQALEWEDIPLEKALAAANGPAWDDLFNIRVIFRNHEQRGLHLEDAICEPAMMHHDAGNCELQLEFLESDKHVNAWFYYDESLFTEDVVNRYARQLLELMEKVLLNPNQPLNTLFNS